MRLEPKCKGVDVKYFQTDSRFRTLNVNCDTGTQNEQDSVVLRYSLLILRNISKVAVVVCNCVCYQVHGRLYNTSRCSSFL